MNGRSIAARQRGEGRLKVIVTLAILVFMIYAGVLIIPILIDEYEFQDAMTTTARIGAASRQSADDIRKSLAEEAKNDGVPLQPEDIHVQSLGGHVEVSASYSVTVNLQVYQWTLTFNPSATAAGIGS
jgi:hypothetical protein